ncbi:MAG: hypothetical protein IT427_01615 [Pirellulales bacterium]|nr:hypothetical protein [Pirellulales bacterium]
MQYPWLLNWNVIAVAVCILAVRSACAQRVQFPTSAPVESFGSSLQPPPPTFDPYAMPSGMPTMPPTIDSASAVPGAYSPYTSGPIYGGTPNGMLPAGEPVYTGDGFATIGNAYQQTMRFMQEIHVDETWLARGGGQSAMGVNTINTWVAFALPFYYNANPLLITPGFQLSLWDGPVAFGTEPATLPGQTYGAYLDFAWYPKLNNWFGAELEVSPGIYTDFQHTTSQSLRILGRGLGVFTISPTMQFKVGVWYIDRNMIKLLPAVGIVCTPNPDSRYEIFFPAPKLAHRCNTIGNHNIWAYVRGEYGGGAWTVERPPGGSQTQTINDDFDYNDLRVAFGVDILPETPNGLRGYLEVGYVFNRQLVFRSGDPSSFNLTDTLLVGGGLSY